MPENTQTARWPEVWGPRPRRPLAPLIVGLALLIGGVAMLVLSQGAAGPVASGIAALLFALTTLLLFARPPVGSGLPQLVDTAPLSATWRMSNSAAVHLVPERRAGIVLTIICALWAIAFAATAVVAVAIGLAGRPQAFLGAVIVAVLAALFVFATVRGAIRQRRTRHDSPDPVGLGISRTGLTVAAIEAARFVPWTAVRDVEADRTFARRWQVDRPLIRLRVDADRMTVSGRARRIDTVTIDASAYAMDPAALWAALRAGAHDADARRMFGTPSAAPAFEEWAAAAPPAV